MASSRAKLMFFHVSRALGLFALARRLTRRQLRILCYHGFSAGDECDWAPGLMIHPDVLKERMRYLAEAGYAVLGLSEALDGLARGDLPDAPVVITVDDGFKGVRSLAHDVFAGHCFPYTVYLTSFYSDNQAPVFNLLINYMLWKAGARTLDLSPLLGQRQACDLSRPGEREQCRLALVRHCDSLEEISDRYDFIKRLSVHLGLDYSSLILNPLLKLLSREEIREMSEAGVDFQLHTHTHRWPSDRGKALRQLAENKRYLDAATGKASRHFCYPSGGWRPEQIDYLREFGAASATTCDFGFETDARNIFCLKRILDKNTMSQVEFEAIMSGYKILLRKAVEGCKRAMQGVAACRRIRWHAAS